MASPTDIRYRYPKDERCQPTRVSGPSWRPTAYTRRRTDAIGTATSDPACHLSRFTVHGTDLSAHRHPRAAAGPAGVTAGAVFAAAGIGDSTPMTKFGLTLSSGEHPPRAWWQWR